MLNWIFENWYLLVAFFAVAFLAGFAVYTFAKLPTATQIAALKEWLKYAVTMAEKELGSGTGQLKLRMVYDLFVQRFTYLAAFISFDTFSGYVDEALEWLNKQLSENKAVSTLVNGSSSTETETTAEKTAEQ